MQYRRLGQSGLKVSALGLGTWLTFGRRLDRRRAGEIVERALGLGINFFDTADVYAMGKAEEILAGALAGVPRKDYVLASKVYFPTGAGPNDRGLSRKHIDETVYACLLRLRTDYIDLMQCHRFDEETPLAETIRAFDDLIRQGKLLYWGVSMWTADQIEQAVVLAHSMGAAPPVSNQPNYSLLKRDVEAEVVPACRRHGLGILPFSPLGQGVLTGKYQRGARPKGSRASDEQERKFLEPYLGYEQLRRVERLIELAAAEGLSPAQLSIAWLLSRPAVSSVLAGATRIAQLEENAKAVDAQPSDEVLRQLDRVFAAN